MNKIIFGMLIFFSCASRGPNYINNRDSEQRMNTVMREGERMRKKMAKARRRGSREKIGIVFNHRTRRKYIN